MTMPVFQTPVAVESMTFKNLKEISDFEGFEEDRRALEFSDNFNINYSASSSEEDATAVP
jgi:hypothetical protein